VNSFYCRTLIYALAAAAVLIARIPCIFNVLKANQLFPSPFFSLSVAPSLASLALAHEKLISDSSGVPVLAAMFIANVSTRTGVVRVCAHTDRQQQRKVEANE
jgi:hypothetical protein